MYSKQLSDGLADLARADERKRDAALLRATTELFVLDVVHDRDEIHRYEELAIHFLPKVSIDDRKFVAERLAICSDAPQLVIRTLARDVIEVAEPIIRYSSVLGAIDLLAVIAATGAAHHRLVATRSSLPVEVSRALRLTGDTEAMSSLDRGAPQRGRAMQSAIDVSAASLPVESRQPAATTSRHPDPWHFLGLDHSARLKVIAEIASRPPPQVYAGSATRLDRAFRSILSAAQIVGFARSGQLAKIIAAMADGLDLPPALAAAAVHDASGEVLAVLLKGLRLNDVQARQVFLLASPSGREVRTFFPLSDLYAGMEPSVAETLIDGWRDAVIASKATHEQHFAENGDRRRQAAQPLQQAQQPPAEQAKRA